MTSVTTRGAVMGAALLIGLAAGPAAADKIANQVAVFTGLDKITGRIITFEVYIDETVQFGALRVTPHVCYTRPPTETAQTDAFVDVDEITLDDEIRRIFTGWMFAASPGLNAVEHPVYDVWLTDCLPESDLPPQTARADGEPPLAVDTTEQAPAGGTPSAVGGIPIPRPKPPVPAAPVFEVPDVVED
jgi:hypothetical protein